MNRKRFELIDRPLVDWIYDKKLKTYFDETNLCYLVDLLNEQYEKINELESKHLLAEFEWKHYCSFKRIEPQIKGCMDRENVLIKENQQLKQFQSQKAIEVLERLRNFYNSDSDSDWIIDCCKLDEYIDNQLTELRGEEND